MPKACLCMACAVGGALTTEDSSQEAGDGFGEVGAEGQGGGGEAVAQLGGEAGVAQQTEGKYVGLLTAHQRRGHVEGLLLGHALGRQYIAGQQPRLAARRVGPQLFAKLAVAAELAGYLTQLRQLQSEDNLVGNPPLAQRVGYDAIAQRVHPLPDLAQPRIGGVTRLDRRSVTRRRRRGAAPRRGALGGRRGVAVLFGVYVFAHFVSVE